MPEGHSLHRLARDQQELTGRRVTASSPQGRFRDGAAAIDGRTVQHVEAYGKHLHVAFDRGPDLHVHLGMQGKWLRLDGVRPPLPQVRLRLAPSGIDAAWDLIAPSTCELLSDDAWAALVNGLGPDPLRPDADADEAWERLHGYGGPVGAALLDQSVIAGVGNVLRAEVLFAVELHPRQAAASLSRAEFDHLWTTLRAVMAQAVDDGRILTSPLAPEQRSTVAESDARMVYRQDRCRACGTPVETGDVGGRTAYVCPRHQPITAFGPPGPGTAA